MPARRPVRCRTSMTEITQVLYTVCAARRGSRDYAAAMKFSYFRLMPYTGVTDPGPDWPVPNRLFDPAMKVKL